MTLHVCVYTHVFFSVVVSCREGTTCLAPDLIITNSLPPANVTVTNTSLEVWWGLPSLEACCAAVVFSYPLVQYRYKIDTSFFDVSKYYKFYIGWHSLYFMFNIQIKFANIITSSMYVQLFEFIIYLFQDTFDTHLRRDNLEPFTSYEVFLQYLNLYTLRSPEDVDFNIRLWLNNVQTDPGG